MLAGTAQQVFKWGGGGAKEGGGMLVDFYSISLHELNESSKNYAEFTHQIKKVFHFVWKSNQNFFLEISSLNY